MHITWHGLNCVRIVGKDVSIVIDPYSSKEGLQLPRWQTDIIAVSSDVLNPGKSQAFVIDTPGEYEIKGAFIYGIPWRKEKNDNERGVLFRINLEDVSIGHLGALDRVVPNNALEMLEDVDILILPIGDPKSLSVKDAVEVISRIEPRVVIPTSFAAKGFKTKLDSPDVFFKQLGLPVEKVDKLKIARKDLPESERKVYQIEIS